MKKYRHSALQRDLERFLGAKLKPRLQKYCKNKELKINLDIKLGIKHILVIDLQYICINTHFQKLVSSKS